VLHPLLAVSSVTNAVSLSRIRTSILRCRQRPLALLERRLALSRQQSPGFSRIISPGIGTQPQHTERREQRSDVQLAVTVYGFATTGKLFVEHCSTRNVSHSGCCIRLRTQPQADSALALRPLRWGISSKGTSQLLFQVAWLRQDGDGWLVGASSFGSADFYCLAFPGTPWRAP
jgi:hypothetical protein